jgi:hypothetical protein
MSRYTIPKHIKFKGCNHPTHFRSQSHRLTTAWIRVEGFESIPVTFRMKVKKEV